MRWGIQLKPQKSSDRKPKQAGTPAKVILHPCFTFLESTLGCWISLESALVESVAFLAGCLEDLCSDCGIPDLGLRASGTLSLFWICVEGALRKMTSKRAYVHIPHCGMVHIPYCDKNGAWQVAPILRCIWSPGYSRPERHHKHKDPTCRFCCRIQGGFQKSCFIGSLQITY